MSQREPPETGLHLKGFNTKNGNYTDFEIQQLNNEIFCNFFLWNSCPSTCAHHPALFESHSKRIESAYYWRGPVLGGSKSRIL